MAPGDLLCLEKCLEKSPDRTRDSRRASLYRYHSLFLKRERYLEASYFLAWFLFHARCLFIVCERLRIPIPGCHVFHDALPIQRETLRFLPGPLFLYHVHFTHTHTPTYTHTHQRSSCFRIAAVLRNGSFFTCRFSYPLIYPYIRSSFPLFSSVRSINLCPLPYQKSPQMLYIRRMKRFESDKVLYSRKEKLIRLIKQSINQGTCASNFRPRFSCFDERYNFPFFVCRERVFRVRIRR